MFELTYLEPCVVGSSKHFEYIEAILVAISPIVVTARQILKERDDGKNDGQVNFRVFAKTKEFLSTFMFQKWLHNK